MVVAAVLLTGTAHAQGVQAWSTVLCIDATCYDATGHVIPALVPATVVQRLVSERDNRPFALALGAFITTAVSDLAVTEYRIGRGEARETWFGAAWQDSPVAFGLTKGALIAAAAILLQRIHSSRPRTAFWIATIAAGVEGALTARNSIIQRR
jgi:hypothetical protein